MGRLNAHILCFCYVFSCCSIAVNLNIAIHLLKFHTDFEFHSGFAKQMRFLTIFRFEKIDTQLRKLIIEKHKTAKTRLIQIARS